MDKRSSLLQKVVTYGRKSFITLAPGRNLCRGVNLKGLHYKAFYGSNFCRTVISRSVCHCQLLPPGLKFANKVGTCQSGAPMELNSIIDLPTNIHLGWITV